MNKKIILFISASLASIISLAAPRTQQEARQIAHQILEQPKEVSLGRSLYIYNNEEKPGFVIVSGSDLLRPVIGYSDSGNIDPGQMPDNLLHWIHWVDEATAWLESHPECSLTESQLTANAISPILGNIAWAQDAPFNNKCPNGSPVGCVATAAAQCVYHYQYPSTGFGSHTDVNHNNLTVNFSQATYDYSLMFDRYTPSTTYSATQLNEVAELSYHCGILADMMYGQEASSSSLISLRRGLVENLNYDPYCQVIYRASHTYSEWQNYLQSELSASRPVIIAGTCNNGTEGHCFVIDGVNDKGLYHVNWGWSGSFNGYYDITVLNPEGTGIGASFSDDGFCTDQSILVQLAPKGKLTNPQYFTSLSAPTGSFNISTSSVNLGSNAIFALNTIYNYSTSAVIGKFGLAFVQNGKIVKSIPYNHQAITFNASVGGKVYGGTFNNLQITLPATLAAGNYQVYPCFLPTSGDFENECGLIYSKATTPSYYTCSIANGKATFSRGTAIANISVSGWSFDSADVSSGISQTISCMLKNNDQNNTLVGKYYLYVTSPSNQSEYIEADKVLTLAPNETGTLSFRNTFREAGQWKCQLYIFYQNIDYDTSTQKKVVNGTNKTFNVLQNTTTGANFSLLSSPVLTKNTSYGDSLFIGAPATFKLSVRNTGEAYNGEFQMQFFQSRTATKVMGTVTSAISVAANSESTYTITGDLTKVATTFPAAATGTEYYVKANFKYGDSFKTFPVATGVSNRAIVKVYAGSPTGIESVESESSNNEAYFDLYGRRSSFEKEGLLIRKGKIILQR